MINRVTQQTVQRTTLANVQLNLGKMSDLQSRMSSGKLITRPSDDPAGTARAMSLRAEKRANEQFSRNAEDGLAWLSAADSALSSSTTSLRKARDLTVQGGNGSLNATAREAIAKELEGVRDALLDSANTTYLGRTVFAGTSDAGVAFDSAGAPPSYAWTGTSGDTVERRLAADTVVRADADGSVAFGTGAGSVFALIDTIAADLRAGNAVTGHLTALDSRLDAMLGEMGGVGTRYGQVTTAQTRLQSTALDLTSQLSSVEDIDLAATILDLQSQEVAYQGALGAASRVLQPTLMDFLR